MAKHFRKQGNPTVICFNGCNLTITFPSAATPLIILMKDEVNPCKYIFRFADEMGFTGRKLKILSLGSGQEEKARETIKESSQVCHCH